MTQHSGRSRAAVAMALLFTVPSWALAASPPSTGPGLSSIAAGSPSPGAPLDLTPPGVKRSPDEPAQRIHVAQRSPRGASPARGRGAAFEAAALAGDRSALSELIRLHREGQYRPRRLSALVPLYAERARDGQVGAAALLGRIYARGELGRRNPKMAAEWFRIASAGGSNEALKELAIFHAASGRDAEALRYARQHENAGSAQASAYLTRLFLNGRDTPRNVTIARKWAIRTASADPRLGVRALGDVLDADLSLASLDALSQTLTKTRVTEGLSLDNVRDLIRQLPAAAAGESTLQRFHKAAANGNPVAALVVGEMLSAERGPDDEEALRFFAAAAKEPRATAVFPLMAALAMKAPDDPAKETLIGYLREASEAGNPHAMKALGRLYAVGGPVSADPAASLDWYRKAAAKGDPEGAFHTGLAYFLGTGTDRNEKEALRWLAQASKGGNTMAKAFSVQIAPPPAAKAVKTKRS